MTIRKTIWIGQSPHTSFKVFCEEMSEWWPGGFGGRDSKVFLEQEVGGRFYERRGDGAEYVIGRVTAYQPPSLVAFTWRSPDSKLTTQVEIRFAAEAGGTRVELEHSGWEQGAKIEKRERYVSGWEKVLDCYTQAVTQTVSSTANPPGARAR